MSSVRSSALHPVLSDLSRKEEAARREDPWDVMARFSQELQNCEHPAAQIPLLLEAVRNATEAGVVFLESGSGPEPFWQTGDRVLPQGVCTALLRRLLESSPGVDGELLRTWIKGCPPAEVLGVRSAALVRLSRSRSAWVVALGFDPERPLEISAIRAMVMARRLLISHGQHLRSQEKLRDTLFDLIHCLTAAIDAKDPYTCGHSERVARIAARVARQMKLPGGVISDVYLAGLLHDIGKIGIRDGVLQKAERLTEEEFEHIKTHTIVGDRIVSNIKQLTHLCPGVRNHHEHWDGQGYPDGLVGEKIPLLARILAVADTCDALMSDRSYRRALPARQIDDILSHGAGSQWDPTVIEHFMACRHELYPIAQRGIGQSVLAAVEHALRTGSKPASHLDIPPVVPKQGDNNVQSRLRTFYPEN
jgi:HD-GYP domain-containing protein (c-di-GMP phosphodiesterase class II)